MSEPDKFPTYKQLILRRKWNELRQKWYRRWRKLLCSLGSHSWSLIWSKQCEVWAAGLFVSARRIPCTAKIYDCRFCPATRGVVDTFMGSMTRDPDVLMDEYNRAQAQG